MAHVVGAGDRPLPMVASVAMQQGRYVAASIEKILKGEEPRPFSYKDKGQMATIGRRRAVVEMPNGIKLHGTIAWFAWLGLHVFYLGGSVFLFTASLFRCVCELKTGPRLCIHSEYRVSAAGECVGWLFAHTSQSARPALCLEMRQRSNNPPSPHPLKKRQDRRQQAHIENARRSAAMPYLLLPSACARKCCRPRGLHGHSNRLQDLGE
jgi:hypothetical protein